MIPSVPIYPLFFNGLTLLIIIVSIILIIRQRGSYFRSVKWLFIGAYILFSTTVILEFFRDIIEVYEIGFYYSTIGVSAILIANWMLTASAITLSYGKNSDSIIIRTFGMLSFRRILPFILYTLYVITLIGLLWLLVPFDILVLDRIYGDQALSPVFHEWYGIGMWILEIFFIFYPALLLVRKGKSIRSPIASRALPNLALAWAGVGFVLLFFNGVLRLLFIEIVDVGNLISASLFASSLYYFRRTSLLESLFEAAPVESRKTDIMNQFSEVLGLRHSDIVRKKILFEFYSSGNYEVEIKNYIDESLGNSEIPIVFSRIGSPIVSILDSYQEVRFFYLTPQISYPKHGDKENEMLLPSRDNSIILSAIDKALKAFVDRRISVIFDNISDLIISQGMEKTYSFINYSLEILSKSKVNAIFLFNTESHDKKIVSTIRSLFEFQIVQDEKGISVSKSIKNKA
jgi:hypothetical protein